MITLLHDKPLNRLFWALAVDVEGQIPPYELRFLLAIFIGRPSSLFGERDLFLPLDYDT